MKMHGRQLVLDYSFVQQPNHRRVMRLMREMAYLPTPAQPQPAPKAERQAAARASQNGDFRPSRISEFQRLSSV